MVFMDKRCGAWQVGDEPDHGAVEFRIFFPAGTDSGVKVIRVAGDFQHLLGGQDWDFAGGLQLAAERATPDGEYLSVTTGDLPAGFYEYKYLVEFDKAAPRIVTDPCARYGGLTDQNSGVVVGGSTPQENQVRPLQGGRRPYSDLTIYELMIDDFTLEYRRERAPLAAVVDRLDELRDLGVTAVEFMPWTAWKNTDFDWGYEPFQYFSVEARYADDLTRPTEKLAWLKTLVSECHDRGIHVIMDGVYNHVSVEFPYKFLYSDPAQCPFTKEPFGGSFPGLQDLDFAEPITQQFILEVCQYWMDVFGIDGIRLDNTVNFYVPGDLRGLPDLLSAVAQHASDQAQENFSLTLEHLDLSAADVTNATHATSFWDNSLFGLTFGALWNDRIDSQFLNSLNNRRFLTSGKAPTLYLTNHDHSDAAWQAGARDNVGAVGADGGGNWWKTQPFAIALFTSTAVPLIRNGQEFGEEHFIPENDHNTGRRVSGRPLRWKYRTDPAGSTLVALYTRLATLRRDHPAFRSPFMYPAEWATWQTQFNPTGVGIDVNRQLAIYHRWAVLPAGVENLVVVLNFSGTDEVVDTPFPTLGQWDDLLATFRGGAPFTVDVGGPRAPVPVGSHWGRILYRLNPAVG